MIQKSAPFLQRNVESDRAFKSLDGVIPGAASPFSGTGKLGGKSHDPLSYTLTI